MHLADAFIQSDLQCSAVYSGYNFFCQYMCSLGIEPTTFVLQMQCSSHWATGTLWVCRGYVSVYVVGYFVRKEEGVFKVAEATQMALFLSQLHLVGMNTQTHTVCNSEGQVVG